MDTLKTKYLDIIHGTGLIIYTEVHNEAKECIKQANKEGNISREGSSEDPDS